MSLKQMTYILKNVQAHSTAEAMKQELPYEHLVTLCKAETGHHRLIQKPFVVQIFEKKVRISLNYKLYLTYF